MRERVTKRGDRERYLCRDGEGNRDRDRERDRDIRQWMLRSELGVGDEGERERGDEGERKRGRETLSPVSLSPSPPHSLSLPQAVACGIEVQATKAGGHVHSGSHVPLSSHGPCLTGIALTCSLVSLTLPEVQVSASASIVGLFCLCSRSLLPL